MQFVIDYSYLIPLLPLLGAVIAGFLGNRFLRGRAHWPIWIGVGCSFLLSFVLLVGMVSAARAAGTTAAGAAPVGQAKDFYTWIAAGSFTATAGFYFDPLTAVMLNVVTGVGLLITIFAAPYMRGEAGYSRFFAYLGLFVFSMTCLVMGDNLVMLYLGWEGVGVCSYLLIGYYYERPAASAAAKKAFIVNRIGDFGFAVGIMLCFWAFGTVTYFAGGHGLLEVAGRVLEHGQVSPAMLNAYGEQQVRALRLIPFCLMLGAFGKSAQFPLYVWLPDAMEGPTPVSALIHAATMVTAGIYMIARCGTLFVSNQAALWTVAAVGAFTALFAATIALRQFDLKKVFAYSTVSQLGYMFVAVGVLAPTAAVFHLVTHAFFKALLFLSCGVVMHAMLGHLDLRQMSGLRKRLPKTAIVIFIGCLALAGCPFTSGFFSKDEIVGYAFDHSVVLGLVLLLTSFLTAYYTFRLYFQVFEGPELVPTTPADEAGRPVVAGLGAEGTSTPLERAEGRASHEAVTHGSTHTSGVDRAASHEHGDPEPPADDGAAVRAGGRRAAAGVDRRSWLVAHELPRPQPVVAIVLSPRCRGVRLGGRAACGPHGVRATGHAGLSRRRAGGRRLRGHAHGGGGVPGRVRVGVRAAPEGPPPGRAAGGGIAAAHRAAGGQVLGRRDLRRGPGPSAGDAGQVVLRDRPRHHRHRRLVRRLPPAAGRIRPEVDRAARLSPGVRGGHVLRRAGHPAAGVHLSGGPRTSYIGPQINHPCP